MAYPGFQWPGNCHPKEIDTIPETRADGTGNVILLVEDNPIDVELTGRLLRRNSIMNELVVAGDGAEALEYIFGTGKWAGRDNYLRKPGVFEQFLQAIKELGIYSLLLGERPPGER